MNTRDQKLFLSDFKKIWTIAFFSAPIWGYILGEFFGSVIAGFVVALVTTSWLLSTIWKARSSMRPVFRWMVYFIFVCAVLTCLVVAYVFLFMESTVQP